MTGLTDILRTRLEYLPPGRLWVGFSAGLDSTVLLHALAGLDPARARGLTALHVHHGLHPEADRWADQARATATRLDVPLHLARVRVSVQDGSGLEAAARAARRTVFLSDLPDPGILALAHHRDDQVETVLLRLFNGAGSEGLAAMRELRPLQGTRTGRLLWRPLLSLPRTTLAAYAREHDLGWIDDPANADPRHARNRLRHVVMPVLREHFTHAEDGIAAAATRLQGESDLIEARATGLLAQYAHADGRLDAHPLRVEPPALARRLFGIWLDGLGLPRPPTGIWSRLQPDLLQARQDAQAELRWHGARVRYFRNQLFADAGRDTPLPRPAHWNGQTPFMLPDGARLCFDPPMQGLGPFVIRPREGGERLLHGGHRREIKKLLQEAGLPPWERVGLPLLWDAQGQLCSVAGRWHSDPFAARLAALGTQLHVLRD